MLWRWWMRLGFVHRRWSRRYHCWRGRHTWIHQVRLFSSWWFKKIEYEYRCQHCPAELSTAEPLENVQHMPMNVILK